MSRTKPSNKSLRLNELEATPPSRLGNAALTGEAVGVRSLSGSPDTLRLCQMIALKEMKMAIKRKKRSSSKKRGFEKGARRWL